MTDMTGKSFSYQIEVIRKNNKQEGWERILGDSRYLVGIGIYFGKSKKKETFIYNSS